jgi:hypothetical protein
LRTSLTKPNWEDRGEQGTGQQISRESPYPVTTSPLKKEVHALVDQTNNQQGDLQVYLWAKGKSCSYIRLIFSYQLWTLQVFKVDPLVMLLLISFPSNQIVNLLASSLSDLLLVEKTFNLPLILINIDGCG